MILYVAIKTLFLMCNINVRVNKINQSLCARIYAILIVLPVVFYYLYFAKQMPLLHFILSGDLIERPDVTGSIPFFYTVSTLVWIVIPSIYFINFDKVKGRANHFIINALIVFMLIASGNKGSVVYYFLFCWFYILNFKVGFKVGLMFIFLIFVYLITKGISEFNADTFSYVLESPFRRFFVTQGACFITRFDMVIDGYEVELANARGIKFDVFQKMYNTTDIVGSCPTFFTGDLVVEFGVIASLIFFCSICLFVCFLSSFSISDLSTRLCIYWSVFSVLFLISLAEISINSALRATVALVNFFALFYLSKIKFSRG
ncbi:hypothetical protein [Vibrio splendidus]|uniref:hypothetical protein n=1 Tax=Vibrio splendidus TaxID=29497 RepID=UPI0021B352D4|nr:hypothetical protein [Vibrio splendidus]UWZ97354.1 hypothetical protein IM698_13330 [Vibrio splendidus]